MKKLISCIVLSAMLCSLAACGGKASSEVNKTGNTSAVQDAESDNAASQDSPEEGQAAEEEAPASPKSELETPAVAESGDAYLAIVDSTWKRQYWGSDDISKNNLAYNAGVAHITGNGDYTVSVTTDSKGYRFATTGNKDDASDVPQVSASWLLCSVTARLCSPALLSQLTP